MVKRWDVRVCLQPCFIRSAATKGTTYYLYILWANDRKKESQHTVRTAMGDAEANIKTVSVKVTEDELKKLSRTRRRRTRRSAESDTIEQVSAPVATPVVTPIVVEKKPEVPVAPVTPPPQEEPKVEPVVKKPIQIGSKRNATRKSSGTTAAAPGTPGAEGNGTLVPKIIYSKKRNAGTVESAVARTFKSPFLGKSKGVLKVKPRKTRRVFTARKIAVTVGGQKLTHRYISPEKMRAELEKHGVLKQNSKMPDEKLRRLYTDFRSL